MTGEGFGLPRSEWALLARSTCSECGSDELRWMHALDLPWVVSPGERLRVFDLISFCGRYADAWLCTPCGNWGVFSDDQWVS